MVQALVCIAFSPLPFEEMCLLLVTILQLDCCCVKQVLEKLLCCSLCKHGHGLAHRLPTVPCRIVLNVHVHCMFLSTRQ